MIRLAVLLLFVGLPLAEIATFVIVGRQIGALATVGLVIVSAVAGILLLRRQGLGAVNRLQQAADTGRIAGQDLADGAMIMLAGILLLLPGFLTDIAGLLLFVPPLRRLIWRRFGGQVTIVTSGFGAQGWPGRTDDRTIDLDPDDYAPTEPQDPARKRLGPGPQR